MASSGNFCTWNAAHYQGGSGSTTTFSYGSCRVGTTSGGYPRQISNFAFPSSGKWYIELNNIVNNNYHVFGIINQANMAYGDGLFNGTGAYQYQAWNGQKRGNGGSAASYGSSWTAVGDVIGLAFDADNGKIWWAKNGTWQASGDPAGNSNEAFSGIDASDTYYFGWSDYYSSKAGTVHINCGQDSSFAGSKTSGSANATDDNGFGDFYYAPPSGFLGLCTGNLPISADIDPAQTDDDYPQKNFNVVTYTGNRTSNSTVNNITGVGFQPDLVWLKILNNTYDHRLVDSSRGVTEAIRSNKTTEEQTEANGLYQFGSDGFSVKGDNNYNSNGDPFIGYCWRANGGTTASNSDGDITSTVQANTNAGFSIVTYTGDNTDHRGVGYGSANIGHGLDSAPEFIITKRRDGTGGWYTLHASAGIGYLSLESNGAFQSGAVPFGPALPTTTTFGGYSANNNSGHTYVCYCWHSVEGYSKFGSFEGNADNNGPFIYTGFRPRLLFIKNMDSSSPWGVYDGERPGFNDCDLGAWDETTGYNNNIGSYPCDILSNGFKLRTSNSTVNSAHTWVWGAWGDVPFKYNNTF